MNNHPIGVFDSGLGGLTIADAVARRFPACPMIYFGDTAHLPYGDKSIETIKNYSANIVKMLLDKGCKTIVIACNTISAVASDEIKKIVDSRAHVVNVIDPLVEYVLQKYDNCKIGVIGTKRTVASDIYRSKIEQGRKNITVSSLATPLLVPIIEEGLIDNSKIIDAVVDHYLSNVFLKGIDVLVLGCTHYPLIKEKIRKYYNGTVDIIDGIDAIVSAIADVCEISNDTDAEKVSNAKRTFYVSEHSDVFSNVVFDFFDSNLALEKLDLSEWNK